MGGDELGVVGDDDVSDGVLGGEGVLDLGGVSAVLGFGVGAALGLGLGEGKERLGED